MIDTALLLMCLKIFFSRILDVSLGTIRTILTVKEKNAIASLFGFLEVGIWFLIVREALDAAGDSLSIVIAYAGGFALGTYIGGLIAEKIFSGIVEVRVVTSHKNDQLLDAVRDAGFGMAVLNVNRSEFSDEKYMLMIQTDNKHLDALRLLIHQFDKNAFIMVHETKLVYNGFFKK